MRILHLGFEDPRAPGAGGGSLRNHEVNQRLAERHEIEVVCAAYPGCKARVEDGVSYRHVGLKIASRFSLLAYFAMLPWVVARHARRFDLLVEEFAGPWASLSVGRWTRMPTVGIVQWFFPEAKANEYHLPAGLITAMARSGARSHKRLIAMSPDLADQLRALAPQSVVTVAGLGLNLADIEAHLSPPVTTEKGLLLYLGRLDIRQKGLDTLLDVAETLASEGRDFRIVVAGDGHEATQVHEMVRSRGLSDRVELCGRVAGREKWRLLAAAQLLIMPSRYETFGYVALEAMAAGTPTLGFAIPGLRGTVSPAAGVLVPAGDGAAYLNEARRLLADPPACAALGDAALAEARRHTWDSVTALQEDVYTRARADR